MSVATQEPSPLHRYNNDFRWRVMPSEKATTDGYHDRGFGSKAKALSPAGSVALCPEIVTATSRLRSSRRVTLLLSVG